MSGSRSNEPRSVGSPYAEIGWYAAAIVFGTLAHILPPYLTGSAVVAEPFSFFSFVNEATEKMGLLGHRINQALLFVFGMLIGWRSPRKWALKCFVTMAFFPANAIVEMSTHPTSHNLFPIEFFFYGWETIPALLGAALMQFIRRTNEQTSDA